MARVVIDFWMDGYDSEREMLDAIPEYLDEILSSSGTSFKFIRFVEQEGGGEHGV